MESYLRLKELRKDSGKTQAQIAEFLNIKQNTYSQYENGQREIPLNMLILLAKHYEVSVDYILGLTEIETPYSKY